MNKLFKIIFLLGFFLAITSCNKKDDPEEIQLRNYAEQYAKEKIILENYLKTHKMSVPTANMDVTFSVTTVPAESIWGANVTHGSNVLERSVSSNGVDYIIYYLQLRQGIGESPCNVDGVFTAYKGMLIDDSTTTEDEAKVFDSSANPQTFFNLESVIRGWSEIFPQFKKGTYVSNPDGTVSYNDYGAGVMFVPSGLAYYNFAQGSIGQYTPIMFTFKLYEINRQDRDFDGVPNYLEDKSGATVGSAPDGYIYNLVPSVVNLDDTDKDGFADYVDQDDDGDNILTRVETKRPNIIVNTISVTNGFYPYNGVLIDDPSTPNIDERQGIPSYVSPGVFDYTSANRLRLHLDKNH